MSFLQWVAHNTKKQVSEQLELKDKEEKRWRFRKT